ncbi:Ycf51 family protein [Synechococcus sp. PCC 6312]|uniref:Ycf51 family protein n=1 Tax=Synechococcus sp. (strain ATCC 27167 / PCC 6312) TaxID=195253 RepID=UPI00029F17F0|nr:Ycf51 family protein [Synechococcus sp. PCC 6312]AFY59560.1 Protein of function (DUF2518) [Synechococcus sp. PCC 6312]
MFTPDAFLAYGQWSAWLTLGIAGLAGLGFLFKWGFRFRLVGSTGFMIVLTAGLFALSIVPLTHTQIPGAVRYSLVFDNGANLATIAVPSTITATELEATLRQAASDLFSPGRLGVGRNELLIQARTVTHPQPSISQPLVLGQVKRSLVVRDDKNLEITIFQDKLGT